MASLSEVVKELQGQNETLIDVSQTLAGMLREDKEARQEEERRRSSEELQKSEADIESRRRARVSPVSGPANSFGSGLSKGLGLDALTGGIKALLGPFLGTLGGSFAGLSIGGLIGSSIGYLFRLGVGALLGKEFITPIFEKYLPTWLSGFELFGEGEGALTAADVGGYVTGAVALLFGPKLVGSLISKGFASLSRLVNATMVGLKDEDYLDKNQKEGLGKRVKGRAKMLGAGLVRNLALAGIIGLVGSQIGTGISNLTGSEELGIAVSQSAEWATIGALFFGPAGAITLALASLAVSGLSFLGDWLRNKDKMVRDNAFKAMEPYNKMTEDQLKNLSEDQRKDLKQKAAVVAQEANRASQLGISQADKNSAAEELANAQATLSKLAMASPGEKLQGAQIASLFAQLKEDPFNTDVLDRLTSDLIMTGQTSKTDITRYVGEFAKERGKQVDINQQKELTSALELALGYSSTRRSTRDSGAKQRDLMRLRQNDSYLFTGPTEDMVAEAGLLSKPIPGGNYQSAERDIQTFLQTGQFPKYEGITPKAPTSPSLLSQATPQPVVQQTLTSEDAKATTSKNVIINNVDNSNNAKTVVNKGGDAPLYLGGGMSAVDLRYERQYRGMLGFGHAIGNVF